MARDGRHGQQLTQLGWFNIEQLDREQKERSCKMKVGEEARVVGRIRWMLLFQIQTAACLPCFLLSLATSFFRGGATTFYGVVVI